MVSITHEQNIICSKTLFCRSHGGLSANEKEGKNPSDENRLYICKIDVIPTDNSFMHAEVTSPNTLTSREEERRLCQPQTHSLICGSFNEMDESVILPLQVQLRNMHNKTIIGSGFRMIAIIIKASVCVIRLSLWL